MPVLEMIEFVINNPKVIWGIISLFAALVLVVAVVRAHFSKEYGKFNLINLFAFDKNGNLSDSKLRLNVAFVVTSWAFVYITMADKLTEWFVMAYLAAWVTDRFFARKQNNEVKDGN